jgi:hypothetical protein
MEVVRPNGTSLMMILVIAVMLQEEVTDVSTPRICGAVNNMLHILLFGMLCIYRLTNFCFIFSLQSTLHLLFTSYHPIYQHILFGNNAE